MPESNNSPDSSVTRFDVLVVGAGYTGLTTACALAHKLGSSVTIGLLDRNPWDAAMNDPRASALSAGAVNALDRLGVWQTLIDKAQPVEHIDITDPVGDSPLRQVMLSYQNTVDNGSAASWIVENHDLRTALRNCVTRDERITILPTASVVDLQADPSRAIVSMDNGEAIYASLVIAADGGNSPLRRLAGIKTTGWPYNQTGIVTTVRHDRPHNATATQHFLPAGPFAILPLRGNRASIVWSEEASEAAKIMAFDDETFLNTLFDRFGTRLGEITLDGPRASWPLQLQLARELVAPRLVLVGEAARTVHPIAGQGLNLAIRDIAALADTLSDNISLGIDPGNADVLAQYAQWRRFDSGTSALAFDAINRLFSNANPLVRSVRDAGLELVGRSESMKSFFVREAAGLTGDAVPSLMQPRGMAAATEDDEDSAPFVTAGI